MEKYITLEKAVGETPLTCAEDYRAQHPELNGVSMAYAGRLDPMASGKLLVLLGEECKNQAEYHNLDKAYIFSVLLGIGSDTHDVLGRLNPCTTTTFTQTDIATIIPKFTGNISLPYPHFSAKTVQGKPLHMWTLENRLDEIEIPTKDSVVYSLSLQNLQTYSRQSICSEARAKIDTIPEVTDPRKALGNDFRRVDVRQDWGKIADNDALPHEYQVAEFSCTASSGTYMRTLAKLIAEELNTCGLAWNIHRTHIGTYDQAAQQWTKEY